MRTPTIRVPSMRATWVDQGQLGRAAAMGTILIVSLLLVIVVVLQIARMLGTRMVGVRT